MNQPSRRFTANDLQKALGEKPFVVRDLWPGTPGAADTPPRRASPDPAANAPPRPAPPEPDPADEPRRAGLRSHPVPPRRPTVVASREGSPGGGGSRKRPAPRNRPLATALLLAGTVMAAGAVGVEIVPLVAAPRDRPAGPRPASPTLAAATPEAPAPAPPAAAASVSALPAPPPAAATAPSVSAPPMPAAFQSDPIAAAAAAPLRDHADVAGRAVEEPMAAPPPAAQIGAADPPPAPDAPRLSNPILAAALLGRAEDALARRDIAVARAFYVRAAAVDPWSADAPIGAGKTYDPGFLASIGASGGLADPAQARHWYARASKLGDPAAAVLAGRLGEGR